MLCHRLSHHPHTQSLIISVDCKEARVPLYKKGGGQGEVGNYLPVSILPVVSKMFERIVYDQLSKHLDKHNILYKYQSGL